MYNSLIHSIQEVKQMDCAPHGYWFSASGRIGLGSFTWIIQHHMFTISLKPLPTTPYYTNSLESPNQTLVGLVISEYE